jgi:hypothetical protein
MSSKQEPRAAGMRTSASAAIRRYLAGSMNLNVMEAEA